MVTLTLATLENQLPLFIKSVIEENIPDPVASRPSPNQWVYKDAPVKPANSYPYIIVELDNSKDDQLAYDGSLRVPRDMTVSIRIIAKGSGSTTSRDTYADTIKTLFFTPASEDVTGTSMNDNLLELRSAVAAPTNYFSKEGDVIKMKEITCVFRYRGA